MRSYSDEMDALLAVFRTEMQHQGITQRDLAERIGMHQSTVSQILTRRYPNLQAATLWRIATGLRLDLQFRATRPEPRRGRPDGQ